MGAGEAREVFAPSSEAAAKPVSAPTPCVSRLLRERGEPVSGFLGSMSYLSDVIACVCYEKRVLGGVEAFLLFLAGKPEGGGEIVLTLF